MAVQRRFQTADTASSTLAVKPSAFSVAAGPRKTTNTTCSSFEKLSDEFASFHSNSLNVVLHLITTPLLYIAALALLASVFPGSTTGLFLAAYGGILIGTLPYKYGIPSIACLFLFSALVGWMRLCTRDASILFLVCYVAQDLAHFITNEQTFQSAYTPNLSTSTHALASLKMMAQFLTKLSHHTFYLLPLCFDAAARINLHETLLESFVVADLSVFVRLNSAMDLDNLGRIRLWLDEQKLPRDITTHYWFSALPKNIMGSFREIANSSTILEAFAKLFPSPAYRTIVIDSMNEVYVATLDTSKATSDNVFYSNHVDGPWMCYPFASVYRCIIAVNPNEHIMTVFPSKPTGKVLTQGDVMAFDFNREVHRIEMVKKDPGKTRDYRYALKVHYLVYPAALPYYGYVLAWLTSVYDTIARLAFLKAIKPKTMLERGLWAIIMVSTKIFFLIFRAAGNSGAFSFVIAASIFTNFIPTTFPVFLTTTSFIHYFIYMGTYYHQKTLGDQMNYEGFKHTVMFYKAVAFFQMILIYYKATVTVGSPDWLSLGLIALGFGLSGSAAAAIGIDRTYFGIELGKCKPEYVTTFPYNILQHPMIIGNCIGLIGFAKLDGFRIAAPWLIPTHISLYLLHMAQEHYKVFKDYE